MSTRALARTRGERIPQGEAVRRAAQLLAEGLHLEVGASREEAPAVRTLRDLLECWAGAQSERRDLRPATLAHYLDGAAVAARVVGEVQLDRVGGRTLEELRDRCGRGARATAQVLLVVRMAWRWGHGVGLVELADLPAVRLRVPPSDRRTPEPQEVQAVIDHVGGVVAVALRLAWALGARVGEISELRHADVDLTTPPGWVTLRGKTGPRRVPLPRAARAALDVYGAWEGPLVHRRWLMARLRAGCLALGQEPWSVHGLRRLAVDQLARGGVDVATAAALLGHSPAVMLGHYRRVQAADLEAAVARVQLGEAPAGQVIALRPRGPRR
jgi:integrase